MAYDKIRDILEYHLTQVVDIPQIAWENVNYKPSDGTPYVAPELVPTSTRPAVKGINPQKRYQGLYRVKVCYPEGEGPQDIEACVNNILTTFGATKDLSYGGEALRVEYSERNQARVDSPWVYINVNIAWYYYD